MASKRWTVAAALAGVAGGLAVVAAGGPAASADGRVEVATSAELIAAFEEGTTDEIVMTAAITLTAAPDRPAGADPLDFDGGFFELTPAAGSWALGTSSATGDLTVRNALIRGASDSAIKWINGSVTVIDSSLTDNATAGAGGAIFANGAPKVTIEGSNLDRNTADAVGGAVWTNGDIQLEDSSFFGNRAPSGGAISNEGGTESILVTGTVLRQNEATGGDGGGIDSSGLVLLAGSYITRNEATGDGAGVAADGRVEVLGSAVAGNVASGDGGGVATNGHVRVVNSTATANEASVGGAFLGTDVELVYATVVGNVAPSGAGAASSSGGTLNAFASLLGAADGVANCAGFGSTLSEGWNLEGGVDTCGLDAEGDLTEVADLALFPSNDFSSTLILSPRPASPAVDRVPLDRCAHVPVDDIDDDQIGHARPAGAGCDVGAVENDAVAGPPVTTPGGPDVDDPDPAEPPPAVPLPGRAAYTG